MAKTACRNVFLSSSARSEMSAKRSRIERKKKKIAAFLEVAKLNDLDKEQEKIQKSKRLEEEVMLGTLETVGDKVGPSSKKLKKNHSGKNESKLPSKEGADTDGVVSKEDLSEPSLNDLKKEARERMNQLRKLPKFRLKEAGEMASFDTPEDKRVPLFMIDIQHLIMCSLLGHHAPFDAPRWYQLLKYNKLSHTTILVVDDVSLEDLQYANGFLHLPLNEEEASAQPPKELFPWRLELVGPSTYGSNLFQEMATIPLSNTQYDKIVKKYGNLEKALKGKAVYKVFRAMFPVTDIGAGEGGSHNAKGLKGKRKDQFPRTDLLLSVQQMLDIGYPLPLKKCTSPHHGKQPLDMPEVDNKHLHSVGELLQSEEFQKHLDEGQSEENVIEETDSKALDPIEDELYVLSKPHYKEVGPDSPMFAIDCEMCMTGKKRFELTRISMVDEELNVVYESYVKPYRKITNYLTRYSGITAAHLKNVDKRLSDVQREISELLPPDAILIGQSLNFDLIAMRMMHPYIIDTSIIFNLTGQRLKRTKLATLSRLFLNEEIQCWGPKGHDSIEDAAAAMKLVLLKLSNEISYGDAVVNGRMPGSMGPQRVTRKDRLANEIGTENRLYATSIFSHVKRGQHSAVVIGMEDVVSEYQEYTEVLFSEKDAANKNDSTVERTVKLIQVEKAKEAITKACEVMLEQQLCIIHLPRSSVGEKLKKLEKWCKKLVKAAALHSLTIVILGGAQAANGACIIHLKNETDLSL